MANEKVMFKKGLAKALPQNGSAAIGTFYLTTDTNRLYVGDESKNLQELNQSITVVNSFDELLSKTYYKLNGSIRSGGGDVQDGQFYYISQDQNSKGQNSHGGNILVVAMGEDSNRPGYPNWIQVNPDTFYRLANADENEQITAVSADTDGVLIETTIYESKVPQLQNDANSEEGAKGSFSIKGSGSVDVSNNGNIITVNGTDTTYTLAADGTGENVAKITLTPAGTNNGGGTVSFEGDGGVTVSRTNNKITISGSNPVVSIEQHFESSGNVVAEIGIDGEDPIVSKNEFMPHIKVGNTNKVTKEFNNGTAELPVYTVAEVDTKIDEALSAAQAMTYKKTIAKFSDITETPEPGHVYKASANFTIADTTQLSDVNKNEVKIGDLLIAEKVGNSIKWAIVPSGDDQFISVAFSEGDNQFMVQENSTGSVGDLGGFLLKSDADNNRAKITFTSQKSTDNDSVLEITAKHGAAGTGKLVTPATADTASTQGTGDLTIPIVTSLKKDDVGHISDIAIKNYVIRHAALTDPAFSFTVNNNVGTLDYGFDYNGDTKSDSISLKSDTLTITADNGIRAELLWGSF